MKIRASTVAGMFYPGDPGRLRQLLSELFRNVPCSGDAAGVVSPHAGYVYSGRTAATAFAAFDEKFEGTFLVIGPSHRGFPTCISQIPWETPLGILEPDTELGSYIDLPVDERAMGYGTENSLEVQMPFIQFRFPRSRIVPIMMGYQTLPEVHRISSVIIKALEKYQKPVKIVASSDFSHYVSAEKAYRDDHYAIEALIHMDVAEFFSRIQSHNITACGYGPIGCMIEVLKTRGKTRCDLLEYTTSGEVSGDYDQVVGYAALAVR
ncbi:MAG TPA: AmmeMemoRadiSam system protein B [Methanospirillum sp.]|uniref:AmmeMemoRadiSam system protein B n=1 Tax=Methanospirillum sp. TaxID=45200 RepID=UPI002B991CF1|nr:AmmeMemoRadiSam system protein B [Methanospirillum sp.]HOJ97185.1 AmmeMemoRadiSam system protein B [Methanospirillum sp.]HPP78490.1 AmmeMemoRadiSam system protein B [Methanospirillum sp.]